MVFLVSCVVLGFEVSLTRICCVLFYYHMSFAIISCAMLGLGTGGLAGYFLASAHMTNSLPAAAIAAVAFSPCLLLVLTSLVQLPLTQTWYFIIPLLVPPFFAAGIFQSLVFRMNSERAELIYAMDLSGAAIGAALSVVLINTLKGPINSIIVLALLSAAGSLMFTVYCKWLLSRTIRRLVVPAAYTFFGVAGMTAFLQYSDVGIDIDYLKTPNKMITKMLQPTPAGVPRLLPELTQWDSSSRIDVIDEPDLCHPGTTQRTVFIDGEVPSAIPPLSAVWSPHNCMIPIKNTLTALPYHLFSPAAVLCIGAGGGYDVVMARLFGVQKIDALELNKGVLNAVEKSRDFTGDIYDQPGVRAIHAEGRQFVRSAPKESYDLVVMALAQSLISNLAEYALSENYLYTSEAFCDYLRVLRPGGALAVTLNKKKLLLRLEVTARQALKKLGYSSDECIIALSSKRDYPYDYMIIVKKGSLTIQERLMLAEQINRHGYQVINSGALLPKPFTVTTSQHDEDEECLKPATDNRPFFFHITRTAPPGLVFLLSTSGVLLGVSFIMFVSFNTQNRKAGFSLTKQAAYFVCLGLAFMMVEVLVMQKTIFIIGFPTLNLAVILAVFLFAAGLGSRVGGVLLQNHIQKKLSLALFILGISIASLIPLLDTLKNHTNTFSLMVRCVMVGGLLFPFAFLMGMPFPLGIKLLSGKNAPHVPWVWGMNGVASIVGSVMAISFVLNLGYRMTALFPAALYCAAAAIAYRLNGK